MGLDMFLEKKNKKGEFEEVGYWRKANQIHKWFVDNVQNGIDNGDRYKVTREQLEDLLYLCKEVKEKAILEEGEVYCGTTYSKNQEPVKQYCKGKIIKNVEEISELLPTQEGFFFGSTSYDEYYMEDIENTIKTLTNALEENKQLKDFYYLAWW